VRNATEEMTKGTSALECTSIPGKGYGSICRGWGEVIGAFHRHHWKYFALIEVTPSLTNLNYHQAYELTRCLEWQGENPVMGMIIGRVLDKIIYDIMYDNTLITRPKGC